MMFKYVRIWQNDKKLDEWGKKIRKKLPNKRVMNLQEHLLLCIGKYKQILN